MSNHILDKVKELNLNLSDLEMYFMHEIQLGMKIDNRITPIYIKHKPTNKVVICKENRSQHKNMIRALEILAEQLQN